MVPMHPFAIDLWRTEPSCIQWKRQINGDWLTIVWRDYKREQACYAG
jgi:hypothetical protein